MPTFAEVVGALMALASLGVAAYAAVVLQSEQALGAILALLSIATGYFLRGKLQRPTTPDTPPTPTPDVER